MSPAHDDDRLADMTEMYRSTIHPLYEFVSRRTGGSRQLAEDITQETYLRAVAQWRGARRPENALAWLQTVARNLLLNHYRGKRPESLETSHLKDALATAPVDDPEAAALVYWGLARLGRRPRRLLEAFYIEGQSTRLIAADFGLSERAVEGRLRRARHALRDRLESLVRNHGDPS
jgi:RNA polymerase sigma-70 factor (ECF subfamily)